MTKSTTPVTPATQSQQSPINLRRPYVTDFGVRGLTIHWDPSIEGKLEHGDHGLKVTFTSDVRMHVELEEKKYYLTEFHFHERSEHTVDGKQHGFELHAVHQHHDDGSRVVVGVFIDEKKAKSSDKEAESYVALNPNYYLPKNVKDYYRYEGSLTTCPYTENVSWVVLRYVKELPGEELSALAALGVGTARMPQPLNRRFLLANFKP